MGRAQTLGDQFPGDDGDDSPQNPTRQRALIDYPIGTTKIKRPVNAEASSSASAGSEVTQYKLRAVGDDEYSVVKIDSDGTESDVEILLKPYLLRRSVFDGQTVGGKSYEYLSATTRKVTNISTGLITYESIVPDYIINNEIMYAASISNDDSLIELNANGHHWSPIYTRRVQLVEVGDDYLTVLEIGPLGVTIGDPFDIAKPYGLQLTPWDGQQYTANGYTIEYSYEDNQTRVATIVGGPFDGDAERQIIIPQYVVDDIIIVGQLPLSNNGLAFTDLNLDARAWARKEIIS